MFDKSPRKQITPSPKGPDRGAEVRAEVRSFESLPGENGVSTAEAVDLAQVAARTARRTPTLFRH